MDFFSHAKANRWNNVTNLQIRVIQFPLKWLNLNAKVEVHSKVRQFRLECHSQSLDNQWERVEWDSETILRICIYLLICYGYCILKSYRKGEAKFVEYFWTKMFIIKNKKYWKLEIIFPTIFWTRYESL